MNTLPAGQTVQQLFELSKKDQLFDADIDFLKGDKAIENFFRKGGLGLIRNDVFIVLDKENNEMLISGATNKFKPSKQIEIIFCGENGCVNPASVNEAASLIAVVFTPQEVFFINPVASGIGKYERHL